MEVACYVGIDVAKDRLDVYVRPIAKMFAVANDEEGIGQLLQILLVKSPPRATPGIDGI